MQNRSYKSVFFPKIAESMNSLDLLLKEEQIIKSLQSQCDRNSFFYRFQHTKTTQSKKQKKNDTNIEHEKKTQSLQEPDIKQNQRSANKRINLNQKIHIKHSQSVPINIKQKLTYFKAESKSKKPSQKKVNFQEDFKVNNHFCFSFINDNTKKYYRSKRKQKIKTECEMQNSTDIKSMLHDNKIKGLLSVKKAPQSEYSDPHETFQIKKREKQFVQPCNSQKKKKVRKVTQIPITSITGWKSKLVSAHQYFI